LATPQQCGVITRCWVLLQVRNLKNLLWVICTLSAALHPVPPAAMLQCRQEFPPLRFR